MTPERLLIISPVHNEAAHLELVIAAMAAQTRPPDEWIVVDDGSTDATAEILERAAGEVPFMRVLRSEPVAEPAGTDRLSNAAAPRTFNRGLAASAAFTHVGKLDGDIELPPDYFERLLARFHEDERLGIAGGVVVERHGGRWQVHGASHLQHVRGALRIYSRSCFDAIGGVREVLGWDGIDTVLARMNGFRTESFPELVARHHRPTGTAQGRLRGHLRLGRCMYIQGFPAYWVSARAVKVGTSSPPVLSGLTFLAGYCHAALRRVPRFEEPGYREHLRAELRGRAVRKVSSALAPRSLKGPLPSGSSS
jgi:poly-beta-1,6-N-acetyl-D-glucosamine synthase